MAADASGTIISSPKPSASAASNIVPSASHSLAPA
jgi:hypothetical protein